MSGLAFRGRLAHPILRTLLPVIILVLLVGASGCVSPRSADD